MSNASRWGDAEEGEMGRDRIRGIDAETAERLLAGDSVRSDPLADLLAAAAAPARSRELVREEAAVVAFRYARLRPAPARHARSAVRRRWAWLLSIKAAAITVAVAAAGVALAAGTGVLPNPMVDVDSPSVGPGASTPQNGMSATDASFWGTTTVSPGPPGLGSSSLLVGLCHAYVAQLAIKPDKLPDSHPFAALIAAAGGVEKVVAFCEGLLRTQPGVHPSGPPTEHPTGKPSEHPGSAPDNQSVTPSAQPGG